MAAALWRGSHTPYGKQVLFEAEEFACEGRGLLHNRNRIEDILAFLRVNAERSS